MRTTIILIPVLLFFGASVQAQELYVFTEPASNLPSRSISAKLTARLANRGFNNQIRQRYTPEIMFGLHKNWMVKLSNSFSNFYQSGQRWESAKLYAKWRLYSDDGIHRHFRLAAFADGAYTRNKMVFDEMNLDGDNSGFQLGMVGTQLLHKLAVSGTTSYMRVYDQMFKDMPGVHDQQALSYSVSAGYLVFPRSYADYKQVNLNVYVELLGMKGLDQGGYYLDLAPAIQLIFNSTTKLNLGVREELTGSVSRIARSNYFLSLETTFLNALKRKK